MGPNWFLDYMKLRRTLDVYTRNQLLSRFNSVRSDGEMLWWKSLERTMGELFMKHLFVHQQVLCAQLLYQSMFSGEDDKWITASWPTQNCWAHNMKEKAFRFEVMTFFWEPFNVRIQVCWCKCTSPLDKTPTGPVPLFPLCDKKYKNIEIGDLKFKKKKKKPTTKRKLSAIIFSGGEVDMSAQWDPTSNKDQHFFHCFSFWRWWAWSKD